MTTFWFILYVIGFLAFLALALTYVYAGFSAAPWVPTRRRDVKSFLELAGIRAGDKVYDLGCGDGRILIAAQDAGAEAVGYDIALLPYMLARFRGARVLFKDFWNANLRDADVIYCFLSPSAHAKLGVKFKDQLKPGTRIITYVWSIAGWTPEQVKEAPGGLKTYLYRVPSADVDALRLYGLDRKARLS